MDVAAQSEISPQMISQQTGPVRERKAGEKAGEDRQDSNRQRHGGEKETAGQQRDADADDADQQ